MQGDPMACAPVSNEPSSLVGLAPTHALRRLLQLKGIEIPLHELQGLTWLDGSPEAMLRALQRWDFTCRPARIQADELIYLATPTLLRTQEGKWVILIGRKGRQWVLEGEGGSHALMSGATVCRLSGVVLDLSPSLAKRGGLWPKIASLLSGQGSVLSQIAAAALCLQLLALAGPWITGLVLDRALPEGASSMLNLVASSIVTISMFRGWIGWLRHRLLLHLVTRLEITLEHGILEHLLSLPFAFLAKQGLGDFLQAFTGMMFARDLLGEVLLGTVFDAVLALGYLVVMGVKWTSGTGVVILVAGFMGLLAALVGRVQARQQTLEVEVRVKEQGLLTELLKGIGTVKAAGAEPSSLQRWMTLIRKATGFSLVRQRWGIWSEVGLEVLRQGLTIALLIWGGKLILQGELTVGSLFSFLAMTAGFLTAMLGLVKSYLILVLVRPQLARAGTFLEVEPEVPASGEAPKALNGPVIMEDVWFRYGPDRPWVLKGYRLEVDPRNVHTLTGPSGFGKSTILRLLAGLYEPEKGMISIGGTEPKSARHQTLYLPQFIQLYAGSILENLQILSGEAPMEKLLLATQTTGLGQLIETLPMGLQTALPHGGGSLSGGQRQLVALTAAIASEKPLLLMDEPMANLDTCSAQGLLKAFATTKKTICMAAHVGN